MEKMSKQPPSDRELRIAQEKLKKRKPQVLVSRIGALEAKVADQEQLLQKEREERFAEVRRLRDEAYNDVLTGAGNRRLFEKTLDVYLSKYHEKDIRKFLDEMQGVEDLQESERTPEQIGRGSVMMLDIDHFKRVNDDFGHKAGDQVLQQFADIVRSVIRRKTDMLFRMGGEEFLILLPNTNADSATSLAEQIRACVERELVATDGAESRPVTVSIGVASVLPATTREDGIVEDPASELAQNVTGKDVIEATNNADLALYAAKEKRNTVESFELLLHDLPGDEPASN